MRSPLKAPPETGFEQIDPATDIQLLTGWFLRMKWDNSILRGYRWCREISDLDMKVRRGRLVASTARDGQVIGVGTGSSSFVGLCELAKRMKEEGLRVTVIPAASEIALACASMDIPVTSLLSARPDWCFDGADEIGENGDVVKGRGGGLYKEKLVIAAAKKRYIIAEDKKYVASVGAVPVPVEVFPQAVHLAEEGLAALGAVSVMLRLAKSKDGPVITENGNAILDCFFARIGDGLEKEIKALPGVIDSGLCQGYGFEFVRS